ncbi:MAG: hypothetical protein RJA22_815 [Verrucomicrobiota bacterium]
MRSGPLAGAGFGCQFCGLLPMMSRWSFPGPWLLACLLAAGLGLAPRAARGEAMLQLFNLSWNEVAAKLPEIAEAGYTSLWLPPPTKGASGYSIGYDLWDPFDLGDVNQRGTVATRYGTREELLRLVALAHRFGLRVYFDNIMNHRAFEVPRYDANTPTNLYPGMVPGDFHLKTVAGGFYRNTDNIWNYNDVWQVQNLSLFGLVDIAHENPNANHGPGVGSTLPKPVLVRQADRPDYYDFNSNGVRVGFGSVTAADLAANPAGYREDANAYLIRSVRYLMDVTRCDGLRLDAVKHVPSYFFGLQSGAGKDQDTSGYVGQAQLQFNLTHGFTDSNQRNSNFDPDLPRNDALIFGEHLGSPPGLDEYSDAGMRLLDNPLRNHLNSVLGNPGASLAGLEYAGGGGLSAGVSVTHAQSHDNDYAARRELQNAYYFLREGVPLIYTDAYHEESGNPPFPRHADAPYLGQFGDNTMPNLATIHHSLSRGGTRPRWGDSDVCAFERHDAREGGSAADQTVVLFAMNDNYGNPGDISFDDGVAQDDAGMPSTCYPVVNSRGQGLVVGFPPGSRLRQLADAPGDDRACRELLVRAATNVRGEAEASAADPNPVNRKVYVGGQALAPGGGAVECKIPSGGYVAYGYQWPEASRVDNTVTNAAGVVTQQDAIVILQNGRVVPRILLQRTDGPDGDAGFNPVYPFRARGSVDALGNVVAGQNVSNRTYAISVPVVTNAGPLEFLARVDGSAVNVLLKLDGGVDLNSHLGLGPTNTLTGGLPDLRDQKPGSATDVFLGYEQMQFRSRVGPEKFAARNVARNTVRAATAESWLFVVGGTNTTAAGDGHGADYSTATCAWAYHDPAAVTTIAGVADAAQRSATAPLTRVDVHVKVGYELQVNRCRLYYTVDGSEPLGAHGVGQGTTLVAPGSFVGEDRSDPAVDWWRASIPAQPAGTVVRYRIGLQDNSVDPLEDYKDGKRYALTTFGLGGWDPASARIWRHNNLNPRDAAVGLEEGFHVLRARAFLPRDGKSSVFGTHVQTFYYDAQPPGGVIAFPDTDGAVLRSVDYGVVVRADETTTAVEYNIVDADPNNDDAVTGQRNGNGTNAWAMAAAVTPGPGLAAAWPQYPREFRFTYLAVPAAGGAVVTVRLREFTSATFTNRYRTLVRTVACAAPAQTLQVAFPAVDGEVLTLPQDGVYTVVARFSDTLTPDPARFAVILDGSLQARVKPDGSAAYRMDDQLPGDGRNELRFDWRGMGPGQHLIEVRYVGDGLALEAARLVRVNLVGLADTDGDGLPDFWETQNGLNPAGAAGASGAAGDPDGDGFRNLEEYLAGTNPQDAASLLRVTELAGAGRVVSWQSVPGRNYQVWATTNLLAPWQARSGVLTAYGGTTLFTNPVPVLVREFYRVQALP